MVRPVATSGTTSDNEWQGVVQRMTTRGQRVTPNDNEWHRVKTNDNEWYNEWQRMTTSGTTNENKWEQVKESDFGFRMKQNMQCITTIYSGM